MENIFKKKESLLAEVFPKLLTPKEVVTSVFEKPYFRTVSVIKLLTGIKHCLNLHGTSIILFWYESGTNWAGKGLP